MNVFVGFFVIIYIINLHTSNAYVLVQVQKKDDKHTNVDAIIHKTVPSDRVDELTKNIHRNQFALEGKSERKLKKHTLETEEPEEKPVKIKSEEKSDKIMRETDEEPEKKPDIFMRASGKAESERENQSSSTDFASVVDILLQKLVSFTRENMTYRKDNESKKRNNLNFRSQPNASHPKMLELNPDHLIDSLNAAIASKPMKRLIDAVSKEAAHLFRRYNHLV